MLKKTASPISFRALFIWGVAASFFLYEFFLRTFLGSVAGQIIPDLGLNAETFAVVGAAYYVTYGLMQVPVGILTDKFGVKLILIVATLICAGATFSFAHSHHFYSAFLSRLAMGFGSSFAFVCLLVVAATWFPRKNFAFFAGLSQFIGTMGPFLAGGPLIALLVYLHGSWRMTLTLIGLFGVVLSVLVFLVVKNKPTSKDKNVVFLPRTEGVKVKLSKLATNKQAWLVALYSACVYISLEFLAAMWGNLYLQARGVTQQVAGNLISLSWLGYAIGCPLLGAFSDMARRRKPFLIVTAILGFFVTLFISYVPLGHFVWVYGVLFFILGVAATGQNIGFATISEQVESGNRASALGLNNAAVTLSGAIVPPFASYFIYRVSEASGGGFSNPDNFSIGFAVMPVLYLIAIGVSAFFIKETFCRPQREVIHTVVKID